jgi:hypothetical protein
VNAGCSMTRNVTSSSAWQGVAFGSTVPTRKSKTVDEASGELYVNELTRMHESVSGRERSQMPGCGWRGKRGQAVGDAAPASQGMGQQGEGRKWGRRGILLPILCRLPVLFWALHSPSPPGSVAAAGSS